MDINVQEILVGGFSALILVIFLVQSLREAFNIVPRFLPLVTLGVSIVLLGLAAYLPEKLVTALAAAIAVAAAASFTIRYVKNGEQDEPTPRSSSKRVPRNNPPATRVSREERETTTTTIC